MKYYRGLVWLVFLAGTLSMPAGCGSSPSPDVITPALRSLLQAGTTVTSTSSRSATAITGLSITPDGQRVALLYGDGNVVVWAVAGHKKLLSTPPLQSPLESPQIWLTGGGNMLAVESFSTTPSADNVQLWEVGHPGKGTHFTLATDWVWMDARLSHLLIVPNFTETCQSFSSPCRGVPGLLWYDFQHSRLLASAPSPPSSPVEAPNGKMEAQPPNMTPTEVEYHDGTFFFASTAQDGFVTWKPGTTPMETDAQCVSEGTLTANGQLFACTSGQTEALSLWNVPKRRMIRQMLLPDYVADNQQTSISSVIFADNDSELAVAEARQGKPDLIRVYNASNFQLTQTLTLTKAASGFGMVTLWSAARSLIAEEQTGATTSVYYVFSLGT